MTRRNRRHSRATSEIAYLLRLWLKGQPLPHGEILSGEAGFRLRRDPRGKRRLLRTYTFDYTNDGFQRSQGFVVLEGRRLQSVGLAGSPT